MKAISFKVPGLVRGKGRPRATTIGGHARMFTDAKTRNYEAEVRAYASDAMRGQQLFDGPVVVTMVARFMPPKSTSKTKTAQMLAGEIVPAKKPDLDNILKVADAMNGVVFKDDAQVVECWVRKIYSEKPGLDVTVREYLSPAALEIAA